MIYQMHMAGDEQGIDWYAPDARQPALPIPTRPLLARNTERK